MIVPIILDYNYLLSDRTDGLWIFYKFLKFVSDNDSCIIGKEIYFKNPKEYEKTWALDKNVLEMYDYQYPSLEELEKNKKFCISDDIEERMRKDNIGWKELLIKRYIPLEKLIEQSLNKIEELKKSRIDIIVTWYPFYSLKQICKKRNIKLLSLEFSTIRKESYNCTLSTILEDDKYNMVDMEEKFSKFNFSNKIVLTREELIVLFSYTKDVYDNMRLLKENPEYEVGYALGLKDDAYEFAFCNINQDEVIKQLNQNFLPECVLYRNHPQNKRKLIGNIDDSPSSRKFISKCDKIIVLVSNVGYEAMLFGRKVSHMEKRFISSFGKSYSINLLNDSVDDLYKLNFLTFAIYTPFDNLFNPHYIKTISSKSLVDIYDDNIKKIFKEHNLEYEKMKKMHGVQRLKFMLKKIHMFDDNKINEILNIRYSNNLILQNKSLLDEVKVLSDRLNSKEKIINEEKIKFDLVTNKLKLARDELKQIYNSKSWIYASKVRGLYNLIRRRK